MDKEGITNIRLDPDNGKLVIEYGKGNSKIVEGDNLTPEQKEVKNFFQQTGKNHLNQQEVRAMVEGNKNSGNKLGPVVIIGIIALIIIFIGAVIYKNKKKSY